MPPPRLRRAHAKRQIVLLQQGGEAGVDFVEAPAERFEGDVLAEHARGEFLESARQDGDCGRVGAGVEGFFPFGGVVGGGGAVEGDAGGGDGVVEVGAEGGGGGEGVPFGEGELDLFGYWFGAWWGIWVSMAILLKGGRGDERGAISD